VPKGLLKAITEVSKPDNC